MDNVVDLSKKIAENKDRIAYLRLLGMAEASREAIEADPWPVLDKAGAEVVRLRRMLDAIDSALYPMQGFVPKDGPVDFPNPMADMNAKLEAIKATMEKL